MMSIPAPFIFTVTILLGYHSAVVKTMPSSVNAIPSSVNTMPTSIENMPSSVKAMPTSVMSLPSSVRNMPTSVKAKITDVMAIPSSVKTMPPSANTIPKSVKAMITSLKNIPRSATIQENDKADISRAYWNTAMMGVVNINRNHPTMQELKKKHYHWIDIKQLVKLSKETDVENQLVDLDQNRMRDVNEEDAGITTEIENLPVNLDNTVEKDSTTEDDLRQLKGHIANDVSSLLKDMGIGEEDGNKGSNIVTNKFKNINYGMNKIDDITTEKNSAVDQRDSEVDDHDRGINTIDTEVNNFHNGENNVIGQYMKKVKDEADNLDDIGKGVMEAEALMQLIISEQEKLNDETNGKADDEVHDTLNTEMASTSNDKETGDNGNLATGPDSINDKIGNKKEKRAKENVNGPYFDNLKLHDTNAKEDNINKIEENADILLRELIQRFQNFVKLQISFTQTLMNRAASQTPIEP